MLVLIYLMCVAAVFYWQITNVKTGKYTKGKAILMHATFTIAPLALYGIVFILLVGLEEFTDIGIIGEGYARVSLP